MTSLSWSPRAIIEDVIKFVSCHDTTSTLSNLAIFVVACVCVVLPLDISQLAFALVGALVFSILQSPRRKQKQINLPCKHACFVPTKASGQQHNDRPRKPRPHSALPIVRPDVKRASAEPVQAPVFESSEWDVQVAELLQQIAPSADDEKIVGKLACLVKKIITPIFPEVEVVGFTSGDLARKKAFGVAVPDVDIVANVNPVWLADQLAKRLGSFHGGMDPKKLQKSAIRLCTDTLVTDAGFKFRRSAFRGEEPKVTLLVPATCGLGIDAVPINFSVNSVTPLHNAALLTECGQMDVRARELILLVKRWAKDRGICHAAKGHLSPYAWTILCIFFLQAGMNDEESLLPCLKGFKKASRLMKRHVDSPTAAPTGSSRTIAELFRDFVKFYHEVFDWNTEVVSVRSGKRGKPGLSLPLNIIVSDDGKKTTVGPMVEDPFQETHNLADAMRAVSLGRLHEELTRAHNLCCSDSSLAGLLEPWAPTEGDSSEQTTETSENGIDERKKPAKKLACAAPWRRQPNVCR